MALTLLTAEHFPVKPFILTSFFSSFCRLHFCANNTLYKEKHTFFLKFTWTFFWTGIRVLHLAFHSCKQQMIYNTLNQLSWIPCKAQLGCLWTCPVIRTPHSSQESILFSHSRFLPTSQVLEMDELERYMQVIKLVNLRIQNKIGFFPIYIYVSFSFCVAEERSRDRDATSFCPDGAPRSFVHWGSTIQVSPVWMCSFSAIKKAWVFWWFVFANLHPSALLIHTWHWPAFQNDPEAKAYLTGRQAYSSFPDVVKYFLSTSVACSIYWLASES